MKHNAKHVLNMVSVFFFMERMVLGSTEYSGFSSCQQ